jgi:hypothetical protein
MKVPAPTLCPDCRLQRRLAWRVERNLYMRKCDKTGKDILSSFPPDHTNPIYHYEVWYGDSYDPFEYGQDFDFNRPFFEQFGEVLRRVPFFSLNVAGLQNCEYVNQCGWSKNCYMTIDSDENEDCIHCHHVFYSKTCMECAMTMYSERCFECVDCSYSFQLKYSQQCEQCTDGAFLFDCRSCTNCFGCVGLRQKKYCMFNEELGKEEYHKRLQQFDFCNPEHHKVAHERLEKIKTAHPRKYFTGEQNESVLGDHIYESKDCYDCFQIRQCRDCRYCSIILKSNDCMDFDCFGKKAERIYDSQECGQNIHNLRFCNSCWDGAHSLTYCYQCVIASANCFGCVGIKKGEYCILNKKYSKEEYEKLIPKIIEHMKETGEWGEFFPIALSPHAYNETIAQERFFLTKENALQNGYSWQDNLPFTIGKETIGTDQIPQNVNDVTNAIVEKIFACNDCSKNYRLTKQELFLYKQMLIPVPRKCPDCRHRRRMELRNPRKLWKRMCQKCQKEIKTSYAPKRREIVYCEECYLKEVY